MRFTDRKTLFTDRIPLLSIRSIRTDRHMAYTDRYSAGVLDNPQIPKDVVVEAEHTKTKRSNGFGRIVKSSSSSRQNVSKARQKLSNLAAAAIQLVIQSRKSYVFQENEITCTQKKIKG